VNLRRMDAAPSYPIRWDRLAMEVKSPCLCRGALDSFQVTCNQLYQEGDGHD